MSVSFEVYSAVGVNWLTAREIHERVGCWAFTTIRHTLAKMADKDLIEAKSAPHPNGEVIMYRLKRRPKCQK